MKLDSISWKMIRLIQNDGRIAIKTLAHQVGLSIPATSERLKRLEESGIITGFRAVVNPQSVGYNVMAIIAMTTLRRDKDRLIMALRDMPEVIECLHLTGEDSYIIRIVTRDLQHLEDFVGSINHYGETRTSIVLSHPIELRPLSQVPTN